MEERTGTPARVRRNYYMGVVVLCLIGIEINLSGALLATRMGWPLYLDTAGTVIAAVLGGYLPGIVVGLLTNLIKGTFDFTAVYFGAVNVLVAVCAALFFKRENLRRPLRALRFILSLAVLSGALSAVLTWLLNGFASDRTTAALAELLYGRGLSRFSAQLAADVLVNFVDKAIMLALAVIVLALLPERLGEYLRMTGWRQKPLSREAELAAGSSRCRGVSLRTKILLLVTVASLGIAASATVVSVVLYRRSTIEEHTKMGQGVAGLAASVIDAARVDEYLTLGEDAPGYAETEALLYRVRESSPDVQYVYVYQIREDGCHVVFDLDTEDVPGGDPGDVVPFDESFEPYLSALFAGEPIDPIITDDTFGWLLTVYQPVYDDAGVCRCYAAADISMDQLKENERSFLVKEIALFLGFFLLILAATLWLSEYNVILPVNTMALAASAFAYNSEEARAGSVERIRGLEIQTGDELENLYSAFTKTTEDSMRYVADIQTKTEKITRMQNGLIMVLADLVESRDQCTGDHVRKTAAYTRIILEQLRREGVYAEQLTDEYIENVVNSAPLHDVGKIKVTDAVLNKPGKLSDTEFTEMKCHTTAGKEIIDQAIAIIPDSDYLSEAKNLATFHHERWDGRGYPTGLAGEAIPLSARVMAVADVFDALVSRRSYKEGMPFEKAVAIIREGMGTHFDPKVAQAFLDAEDEVRKVAEQFGVESRT